MKIKYNFANDESAEIEVSEEWGEIILDLDRREYNTNQKETRRHASLEAYNADDALFPADVNIETEYERTERDRAIWKAIGQLLPEQQELIRQIYFEGIPAAEIARREGVSKAAISQRAERALKKLKKILA